MYSSLDTEKCWKLSTEKIVEQEMEKFAHILLFLMLAILSDEAIFSAIRLLQYRYFDKDRSESYLLKRPWSIIDHCFDSSEINVATGEKMSKASSDRVDEDRSISKLTTRKRFGAKVDFLFEGRIMSLEPLNLKLPKTLKDMFGSLAEIAPGKIREAKTVDFILSEATFVESSEMVNGSGIHRLQET
ncbi:hypothetical protein VTP01DRAFT_6173 [Rhizomucor pusillus]|uniref:uncharacterized protein n=1 Tax=Rhizomucor pusillus TaxID=4840 RepID=UPI003742EFE6